MFEDDVFDSWLDLKSKEIVQKLGKEVLSSDEMIVLVLKAQTNHFAHLDKDLRSDMSELNKSITERIEKSTAEWREEMMELRKDMDRRFEQVDKRFEQVDKRFEQVDKRFEQVDKRFEQVDKRFEALTVRIDRFMIWSFSTSLAIGAAVVAAIRYLPPVH